MDSRIVDAITGKAIIEFDYDGGLRRIEPHCYGVTKKGSEVLRGYQIGGHSESGNPVGWKLYTVAKMAGLRATQETFEGPRSDYNPNDKAMATVIACL